MPITEERKYGNEDSVACVGEQSYELMKALFPLCRSITGNGVRETLAIIRKHIPLSVHEVPTGTKAFDWTVPREWNISDAYVMDEHGVKVIDFKENNLHVVGYSVPVDAVMPLSELQKHLYSLPDQPDAIPYVTSYYKERWGFCIADRERRKLRDGNYRVCIASELKKGALTYGELIIPGRSREEVFLSTCICHPSMANNELSGPVVATFLAKWVLEKPRRYTYRFVFVPETIGSVYYLSKHLDTMKKNMLCGFALACIGDNGAFTYIPTRLGDTFADKAALNILSFKHPEFTRASFLDRGSDERHYNAPGIDLPVCCLTRSRYGTYPEYHTSLDNMDLVSPEGLDSSYSTLTELLRLIEENYTYQGTTLGEPQLGQRGLYPTISAKCSSPATQKMRFTSDVARTMLNFIAYADGEHDLVDISNRIQVPARHLYPLIGQLMEKGLIRIKQ